MIIYVICFFTSILFIYFAEKVKPKLLKIINYSIAILIPALVAAFRGYNIGTDVSIYAKLYFDLAKTFSSLGNYINSFKSVEPLYLLLTYIIEKTTHSFNYFLFTVQVIINLGVFYYIHNKKDDIPTYLRWSIYLFIFYNVSLNIIRQSIALAIFLCAMTYAEKKEYKKCIAIFIITLFVHRSAIGSIPIILYFIFDNVFSSRLTEKTKSIMTILLLFIIEILIFNYDKISYFLVYNLNLIPEKYYYYIYSSQFVAINNYLEIRSFVLLCVLRILIYGIAIFSALYEEKINKTKKNSSRIYIVLLIIDLSIYTLKLKILNIDRIGFYYSLLGLFNTFPYFYSIVKKNKVNRILSNFIIVSLLLMYWYVVFVHYNMNETIPYYVQIY